MSRRAGSGVGCGVRFGVDGPLSPGRGVFSRIGTTARVSLGGGLSHGNGCGSWPSSAIGTVPDGEQHTLFQCNMHNRPAHAARSSVTIMLLTETDVGGTGVGPECGGELVQALENKSTGDLCQGRRRVGRGRCGHTAFGICGSCIAGHRRRARWTATLCCMHHGGARTSDGDKTLWVGGRAVNTQA